MFDIPDKLDHFGILVALLGRLSEGIPTRFQILRNLQVGEYYLTYVTIQVPSHRQAMIADLRGHFPAMKIINPIVREQGLIYLSLIVEPSSVDANGVLEMIIEQGFVFDEDKATYTKSLSAAAAV